MDFQQNNNSMFHSGYQSDTMVGNYNPNHQTNDNNNLFDNSNNNINNNHHSSSNQHNNTESSTNQNLFPNMSEPAMSSSSWSSLQQDNYYGNQSNPDTNNSSTDHQLQLLFELKDQIDLMYKQINHQTRIIRQVNRLEQFIVKQLNYPILKSILSENIQKELDRFQKNYQFLRKKCRKVMKRKKKQQQSSMSSGGGNRGNLYETLYALFENISNGSGGDDNMGEHQRPQSSSRFQFTATNFCDVELKVNSNNIKQDQDSEEHRVEANSQNLDQSNHHHQHQGNYFQLSSINVKTEQNEEEDNEVHHHNRLIDQNQQNSVPPVVPTNEFSPNFIDSCFPLMRRGPKIKHKPNESFRFRCKVKGCPFVAKYPSVLRTHQATHSNDYRPMQLRYYNCEQCPKSFKYSEALRAHRMLDHPVGGQSGGVGGSGSSSSGGYGGNLAMRQTLPKGPLQCCWPECPFVGENEQHLRQHIELHSDELPYACHWANCNRSFKYKSFLQKHLQRHQNDRPYKCTWPGCIHASKCYQNLQAHLLVHEKRQRFGDNVSFRGPKFYKYANNESYGGDSGGGGGGNGAGSGFDPVSHHRSHQSNNDDVGANTN